MEARFLTELSAHLKGNCIWVLDAPLMFYSAEQDYIFTVPVGFHTDLASVPRVPLIYEAWGNRVHREAVLHDYAYRIGVGLSFDGANRLFLEAMTSRGVPDWIKTPMYEAVCAAGLSSYHKLGVNAALT